VTRPEKRSARALTTISRSDAGDRRRDSIDVLERKEFAPPDPAGST
jgi:hypothetical protein